MTVLFALGVGIAFGMVTSWLKLPLPAPPSLAGIAGVVGVYIGFLLLGGE